MGGVQLHTLSLKVRFSRNFDFFLVSGILCFTVSNNSKQPMKTSPQYISLYETTPRQTHFQWLLFLPDSRVKTAFALLLAAVWPIISLPPFLCSSSRTEGKRGRKGGLEGREGEREGDRAGSLADRPSSSIKVIVSVGGTGGVISQTAPRSADPLSVSTIRQV